MTTSETVDKGNLSGALFLDLSKAFDTISHGSLLKKLPAYGIRTTELNWFQDYLFNRQQFVSHDKAMSQPQAVTCGVPQGSILGPLLFLIFFNDFPECLENCKTIMFADDTVIYTAAKSSKEVNDILNAEINNVQRFMTDNELIVNLKKGKTEGMLFSTAKKLSESHNLNLLYGETRINNATSYKYLGILIDPELRLTDHFENTIRKSTSRLKLLTLIRSNVTSLAAYQIFRAMVQSIIIYGSSTNLNLNRSNIDRLNSIDRRARKIINKRQVDRHIIEPTLNVMKCQACCLVKKCMLGEASVLLANHFEQNNHGVNTRNQNAFIRLPKIRLEVARRGFFFMGGRLYNMLPVELRTVNDFKTFKKTK